MPKNRYAATNQLRLSQGDDAARRLVANTLGTDVRIAVEHRQEVDGVRRLIAHPHRLTPEWLEVLKQVWLPHLLEPGPRPATLSSYDKKILRTQLSLLASFEAGRGNPVLIGCLGWTVETCKAFYLSKAQRREARLPEFMRDPSKLPKAPPGRKVGGT
jgi:hypothetical protein